MRKFLLIAGMALLLVISQAEAAFAQAKKREVSALARWVDFGPVVVGAPSPVVWIPISIGPLGSEAPPRMSWLLSNLEGTDKGSFRLSPLARTSAPLVPATPAIVRLSCVPRKAGKLEASFHPTLTGIFSVDRNPLIKLRCTGVNGIAAGRNDKIRILYDQRDKPLQFDTTPVGGSDREAAIVENRSGAPIEVYARFIANSTLADIAFFQGKRPSTTKPDIIPPQSIGGPRLIFKPKAAGVHARTLEIGWRPVGSKFGWNVKYHVVAGRAVKPEGG